MCALPNANHQGILPNKLVVDFTNVPDPVDAFLDTVLGPGPGYLVLGFARGPKIKDEDYKRPFQQQAYRWPEQRDEARREIDRRQRDHWDVYFCPALQVEPKRLRDVAASIHTLSFELDDEPADPALLEKLDAVIVESGSSGHLHVHTLLDQAVDVDTADRLTKSIATAVAKPGKGVALKWEANAYLRVPDSRNFKSYWASNLPARRRPGGAPRRVRIQKPEGKRWSLDELEALCASLTPQTTPTERRRTTRAPDIELSSEDDLRAFPGVARALRTWADITADEEKRRSDAHRAVTRECYKARISEESAVALLLKQDWCKGDEKWVEDDVAREYRKAAEEGLRQLLLDDFWDQRPILATIRDYAVERMMTPWAVLGHTIVRIAATIPPCYVLPPVVAAAASLNLFIVLCAPSGGNKSASRFTSKEAIYLENEALNVPLGSGEGISRSYAVADGQGGLEYRTDSVIFEVDEISKLKGLLGRSGSTLQAELLSGWSGQSLGVTNAEQKRNVVIPAHRYRLGLHVGVQPAFADAILDHADSGFPQRFLWFAATDESITLPPGKQISQTIWKRPIEDEFAISDFSTEPRADEMTTINIPEAVRVEIQQARLNAAQGKGRLLDSHSKLMKLKVAAVLMWMDQRHDGITVDDWDLAEEVMAHSDNTREEAEACHRALAEQKANHRAVKEGQRSVYQDEAREKLQLAKARDRILKMLADGPETKSKLLTRGMTESLRKVAPTALEQLRRAKQVKVYATENPTNGEPIYRVRLVEDN